MVTMDERVPGGEERARPAELEEARGFGRVAPEPPPSSPIIGAASAGAFGAATAPVLGARSLLDRLRSAEFSLGADRRLLLLLEKPRARRALSPERGRGPVRSPEAAEEELHLPAALDELAGESLAEVRERLARNTRRRRRVLEEMAESGCFEGRWVGDGARAVYLERLAEPDAGADDADTRGSRGSRYEIHQGPWAWVEDAPPGEDPRETLQRGEILARSWADRREFFLLFAVPFLVVSLAYPVLPPAFLLALLAAVVAPLLFYLRRGRRRLLDTLFSGPVARRRKAEEVAASRQLALIQRGVGRPRLEELAQEVEHELARGRPSRGPGGRPSAGRADPADADGAVPGPRPGGARGVAILLSLSAGEKNLGTLLAHVRAFSGAAFAPGPGETADSLSGLERSGLVSKTSGVPPFARYAITPDGARELRTLTIQESRGGCETTLMAEAARGEGATRGVRDTKEDHFVGSARAVPASVGAAPEGRPAPTPD